MNARDLRRIGHRVTRRFGRHVEVCFRVEVPAGIDALRVRNTVFVVRAPDDTPRTLKARVDAWLRGAA